MAEEKRPSADIIAKWKKNVADPNVSEDIKSKFRNLLAKFGEAEVEVAREVEKVVTPKGTRGRKPSATKKTTAKKPKEEVFSISKEFDPKTGKIVSVQRVNGKVVKPKSTRGRKPNPKSQSDIESAKAELKNKFGKTEEECEKIIEQYKALRTNAKKDEVKKQEATATNRTRINKLKKEDNIIEGTDVKTADATIETAKEEVVAKIEQEIEIVADKVEMEAIKVVEKDKTLTPTEKKEKVKKVVEKEVKDKTKVIVKRVIVDTSALLTAISTKLGEFDKDSQKEFLIKLRSDIDKLLTKYAFGGDVMGATQRMNITQSNMSSSSVNSFGKGGMTKSMYADGGLVAMFTANDDSDYVDDVLEQIKHSYRVDDDVLEEIVNDRNFDDVDELQMYFENAYFTYANTDADLGEEYVEMIGSISDLDKDTLERYFDFKKFGLDLAYDFDEYSGHYFNQGYKKGGLTKSRRYDNGGGVDGLKIYQGVAYIEYTNLDGFQENFKSIRYIKATSEQEAKKLFISRLELDTTRQQDWEFESIDIDLVTDPQQLEQAEARGYLSTQKMTSRYDNGGGVTKSMYAGGGVIVYDIGRDTIDRYTIFLPDGSVYGMSENPTSPQGFNVYLGEDWEIKKGGHLGKRLKEIPSNIKKAVMDRMDRMNRKH